MSVRNRFLALIKLPPLPAGLSAALTSMLLIFATTFITQVIANGSVTNLRMLAAVVISAVAAGIGGVLHYLAGLIPPASLPTSTGARLVVIVENVLIVFAATFSAQLIAAGTDVFSLHEGTIVAAINAAVIAGVAALAHYLLGIVPPVPAPVTVKTEGVVSSSTFLPTTWGTSNLVSVVPTLATQLGWRQAKPDITERDQSVWGNRSADVADRGRKAGKLGKLDPKALPTGAKFLHEMCPSGQLPVAPPSGGSGHLVPAGAWGMDGNDSWGDCVFAGLNHVFMLANAITGLSLPVGTDGDNGTVAQAYEAFDHCTAPGCQNDVGADEQTVLADAGTSGYWGNFIDKFAAVKVSNLNDVRSAINLFGCVYIGINVQAAQQTQFENGQPWEWIAGDPVIGGHCVLLANYTADGPNPVTWGEEIDATWAWLSSAMSECWVVVPRAFTLAGKGPIELIAQMEQQMPLFNSSADLAKLA